MAMKKLDRAFNISILHLVPSSLMNVPKVDSLDNYQVTGEFHDQGLYSINYFGPVGSLVRSRRVAHIDIKLDILHPLIFNSLIKLKGYYEDIIAGRAYAIFDETVKDFVLTDSLSGETGFYFFLQHWKKIDFSTNKSTARNERIRFIEKYKEVATTNKILVIPAGLRDMTVGDDGRSTSDEINNLYRRLLGYSNTLSEQGIQHNPTLFNTTRLSLQYTFNELFEYILSLISGKKKLIAGKWMGRRIHHGTRNVITAFIPTVKKLGEVGSVSVRNTLVGLHQFMVSIGQMSRFYIKHGPISQVFVGQDLPARLINKETLRSEEVVVSSEVYDQWMSNEGLDRLLTRYGNQSIRHKPVEIEDHYVALVYKGPDNTFKVFYDIRDLPAELSKKYVTPITLVELMYLSVYKEAGDYPGFLTRYPVSGDGSIYPSFSYVKTTISSEKRYELDMNWQRDDSAPIAFEFPVHGDNFYDTLTPHTTRLAGLGGDFDGDTASYNSVFTDEAKKEVKDYFKQSRAWVNTNGELRMSADIPTINLVLFNLTARK